MNFSGIISEQPESALSSQAFGFVLPLRPTGPASIPREISPPAAGPCNRDSDIASINTRRKTNFLVNAWTLPECQWRVSRGVIFARRDNSWIELSIQDTRFLSGEP